MEDKDKKAHKEDTAASDRTLKRKNRARPWRLNPYPSYRELPERPKSPEQSGFISVQNVVLERAQGLVAAVPPPTPAMKADATQVITQVVGAA